MAFFLVTRVSNFLETVYPKNVDNCNNLVNRIIIRRF